MNECCFLVLSPVLSHKKKSDNNLIIDFKCHEFIWLYLKFKLNFSLTNLLSICNNVSAGVFPMSYYCVVIIHPLLVCKHLIHIDPPPGNYNKTRAKIKILLKIKFRFYRKLTWLWTKQSHRRPNVKRIWRAFSLRFRFYVKSP